jgi:PPM family protein phosphatase
MTRFSHGVATTIGRVRRVNEDSYLALPPLYAVADGMGGHGAGDVASGLAVEELAKCVVPGRALYAESILVALEDANRVIIEQDEGNGMGTTITGLAGIETAEGPRLMVFNVGDSRVYRLTGGRLDQVSVDHSEVQELIQAGALTREQARTHPRRNIVTRALGSELILRPDHWLLPVIAGDRYLLCSDGLFGELTDEQILPLLATPDPRRAATTLVTAADEAGGRDNITVVVVDVDDDAQDPARA